VAVEVCWEVFRGQEVAAVDFAAAATALEPGALPCSPGEREILRIAASIAEGIRWICGKLRRLLRQP